MHDLLSELWKESNLEISRTRFFIKTLRAKPAKWSNTLKQFVGNSLTLFLLGFQVYHLTLTGRKDE